MNERENIPYVMTNSHILVHEFTYLEPGSIAEALAMLASHGEAARLMAGGTDLLVQMKMERIKPAVVIGIGKLAELRGLRQEDDRLVIGALTTIRELTRDAGLRDRYTALAEACAAFSTTQVQTMGTVGGNLCNGSPASDSAPALIALGAEAVLAGPEGKTQLPLERFFHGPGKTVCRPDQMLSALEIPLPSSGTGSAFVKIGRVAADIAKANGAMAIVRNGDRVADCRLALGSVAPIPIRAHQAEAVLRGQVMTSELVAQAAAAAAAEIAPIDDVRSTVQYRRQVVAALVVDGIHAAWERAGKVSRTAVSMSGAPLDESTHQRIAPSGQRPDEWAARGSGSGHDHNAHGPDVTQTTPTGRDVRNARYAMHNTHRTITLTVNGITRRLQVADNDLLLNVLREDMELTGTKYGCGIGECSACTVLKDGQPVLACLVLAAAANGSQIQTVEGLAAGDGTLDPLQEAFLDHGALQCGFCTPGMLMTAKDLLAENPHPTEAEVRDQLRGNMCRCTGYAAIVRAVLAAAEGQMIVG